MNLIKQYAILLNQLSVILHLVYFLGPHKNFRVVLKSLVPSFSTHRAPQTKIQNFS